MHLLLVAATALEVPSADVVTGVGLLAAGYHIQKAITTRRPDLVIQAGVAGAFDRSAPLGTVVVVGEDIPADVGVEEGDAFRSVFDMGLADREKPPYVSGFLQNREAGRTITGVAVVRAITVQEITTRPERIEYYRQTYHPYLESMEGAALHYVCLQEGVPFLQIRALSNYVGERDKRNWKMEPAIRNLNQALAKLIAS